MTTESTRYEHVTPAALGTVAYIQPKPGIDSEIFPVVTWASVNGGPIEALIDYENFGDLTPISEIRGKASDIFIEHPGRRETVSRADLERAVMAAAKYDIAVAALKGNQR